MLPSGLKFSFFFLFNLEKSMWPSNVSPMFDIIYYLTWKKLCGHSILDYLNNCSLLIALKRTMWWLDFNPLNNCSLFIVLRWTKWPPGYNPSNFSLKRTKWPPNCNPKKNYLLIVLKRTKWPPGCNPSNCSLLITLKRTKWPPNSNFG